MANKIEESRRGRLGYGSSYRRGGSNDLGKAAGIGTVLGGQVWMVKPDKEAATANPCIWMESGIVRFKTCNNYYDCTTCKYDKGMQKKVDQGRQVSWQEAMRKKEGLERVCRHSLTQRIAKRACAYDYQCSKCDFDQFFEDVWTAKTGDRPLEVQDIKGFRVPMGHYFHNGHTWARIESGGYIRVGMDDFSLKLLGRSDAFDLPLMGKELARDKAGWGFKREKNRADVLSPVDGVITEVNAALFERPEAANQGPYEGGWLFMVRHPDIKEAMKKLMTDTESLGWMHDEVNTLENMIEEAAGPLAADGGYLAEDIFGNIPGLGWKNLTGTFLRTG
jgi:glycine cleavage system H lipoate-binding protein